MQPLTELSLAAEQGTISWSKLREVVRKAAPETEGYWLTLCEKFNAKQIQKLVSETPWGALPGDVFDEEPSMTTELRCPMSPRVFRMLAQARRLYSIEQEEAVTNADIVEMALATYIAGRPADIEVLRQARDEADKDLQAEETRRLPLVHRARELAQELGLLDGASAQEHAEEEQPRDSDLLVQALGGQPSGALPECCSDDHHSENHQDEEPERPTCVIDPSNQPKAPASLQLPQASWTNPRLRFNPKSRLATKAQRKELLRRDCYSCSTPGCSHGVWLELHHVKSYSEGGETSDVNLCSLCRSCHRNLHTGALQIKVDDGGSLLFLDGEGRRLDRRCQLEVAAWLDWWHGWKGQEDDSHNAKFHHGLWEVAV